MKTFKNLLKETNQLQGMFIPNYTNTQVINYVLFWNPYYKYWVLEALTNNATPKAVMKDIVGVGMGYPRDSFIDFKIGDKFPTVFKDYKNLSELKNNTHISTNLFKDCVYFGKLNIEEMLKVDMKGSPKIEKLENYQG